MPVAITPRVHQMRLNTKITVTILTHRITRNNSIHDAEVAVSVGGFIATTPFRTNNTLVQRAVTNTNHCHINYVALTRFVVILCFSEIYVVHYGDHSEWGWSLKSCQPIPGIIWVVLYIFSSHRFAKGVFEAHFRERRYIPNSYPAYVYFGVHRSRWWRGRLMNVV